MEGQLTKDREPQSGAAPPGPSSDPPGTPAETEDVICRDIIRLTLHKITQSPEFAASIQLRQFLTFVVEASIADPPVPLKGYTIATQALGRDDSFNPATDPIVRVEAARLRKRLEDYYEGTGHNDPVRIIIPKGSYQPGFHPLTQEARKAEMPGGKEPVPAIPEAQPAGEAAPARPLDGQHSLTATLPSSTDKPGFPAFLLHPAVFFPLMALAFAAGFAAARL